MKKEARRMGKRFVHASYVLLTTLVYDKQLIRCTDRSPLPSAPVSNSRLLYAGVRGSLTSLACVALTGSCTLSGRDRGVRPRGDGGIEVPSAGWHGPADVGRHSLPDHRHSMIERPLAVVNGVVILCHSTGNAQSPNGPSMAFPSRIGDAIFWDRDLSRLRGACLPLGPQGLRGAEPGSARLQAVHAGPAREDHRRPGAQACRRGSSTGSRRGRSRCLRSPGRRRGPTVADLADRFMRAHVAVNCKPATAVRYDGLLRNCILPVLGSMPIGSVERTHVADLHYALRDRPSSANRSVDILKKMYSLAEVWGPSPAGAEPRAGPCASTRSASRSGF